VKSLCNFGFPIRSKSHLISEKKYVNFNAPIVFQFDYNIMSIFFFKRKITRNDFTHIGSSELLDDFTGGLLCDFRLVFRHGEGNYRKNRQTRRTKYRPDTIVKKNTWSSWRVRTHAFKDELGKKLRKSFSGTQYA